MKGKESSPKETKTNDLETQNLALLRSVWFSVTWRLGFHPNVGVCLHLHTRGCDHSLPFPVAFGPPNSTGTLRGDGSRKEKNYLTMYPYSIPEGESNKPARPGSPPFCIVCIYNLHSWPMRRQRNWVMKSSFFNFIFVSFGYLNAFDSNHMTSSVAFLTCLKNNNSFALVKKKLKNRLDWDSKWM